MFPPFPILDFAIVCVQTLYKTTLAWKLLKYEEVNGNSRCTVFWGITSTKETSWIKTGNGETVKVELETSQSSKKVDSHACVIPAKEEYFQGSKTVRHIPKEISDNVYYFITTGWFCIWGSDTCKIWSVNNTSTPWTDTYFCLPLRDKT